MAAYEARLAAEAWDTVLVARREEQLEDMAPGLRKRPEQAWKRWWRTDLSQPGGLAPVVKRVGHGDIGFLLHNAGSTGTARLPSLSQR